MYTIEELNSVEKPKLFESIITPSSICHTRINFGITEDNNIYKYFSIVLPPACMSNSECLITALILSKYSANDIQAVVINSIDGSEKHLAELKELQDWRALAKKTAKDVFQLKEDMLKK